MGKEELLAQLRRLSPEERQEILAQFPADATGRNPPQVFLSYSRSDIPFVTDLITGLERGGVRVWFDVRELAAGEDYRIATEKGLKESEYCIVVVSRYSMNSPEVARELDIAAAVGTTILPVILHDSVVPAHLRNLQWIDFRVQFEHPLNDLVARLHHRSDDSPMKHRVQSATKPLLRPGSFVPLFYKNAPPSVHWFNGLLLAGVGSVLLLHVINMSIVMLASVVLLGVLACLILVYAWRVAERRMTLSELRSIWILAFSGPLWSAGMGLMLEPAQRRMTWGVITFSLLALLAAVLIAELSPSFRRWLPARPEQLQILPGWLCLWKRAPRPPAAS